MLPSPDPNVLTAVVRQDQRDPDFEIIDWTVELLSDKGIINPGGLFCLRGTGRSADNPAIRPWSVVLKTVTNHPKKQDPRSIDYWERELLAVQSGLLANLPGPLIAPRFYGTSKDAPGGWLWMEHVHSATAPRWTLEHFRFAAHQLGRFNGAYLTTHPLPDFPWLCLDHARAWTGGNESPDAAFKNPIIRAYFSDLHDDMLRLWDEKELFFAVLYESAAGELPRTFSHFDFQRRNLIIRTVNDQPQLVAVDWSMCGLGPAGADISSLIGLSALLVELDPADLLTLDRLAFEAYLAGLREAGWRGDARLIRLAYTTWFALYFGLETGWTLMWTASEEVRQTALRQFGRPPEELIPGWASLCRFALARAEEARHLIKSV